MYGASFSYGYSIHFNERFNSRTTEHSFSSYHSANLNIGNMHIM